MELLKSTIVVWEDEVAKNQQWLATEFSNSRHLFDGKTDFLNTLIDAKTVRRNWVDEAAARAWINYIQIIADRNNAKIISATIVDNM